MTIPPRIHALVARAAWDADDLAARVDPQTRTIDALDVPTAVVEADALRLLAARVDPETRHQLLDLDPDSTCRPTGLACVNCPPKEGS